MGSDGEWLQRCARCFRPRSPAQRSKEEKELSFACTLARSSMDQNPREDEMQLGVGRNVPALLGEWRRLSWRPIAGNNFRVDQ